MVGVQAQLQPPPLSVIECKRSDEGGGTEPASTYDRRGDSLFTNSCDYQVDQVFHGAAIVQSYCPRQVVDLVQELESGNRLRVPSWGQQSPQDWLGSACIGASLRVTSEPSFEGRRAGRPVIRRTGDESTVLAEDF